jgi:HAD superfamily hydrolase (TIGR01549 family)
LVNTKDLNLTHYCFDMDGTLIDSNKTIYEATVFTLRELKINFIMDEQLFGLKIGQHFVDIFNAFNIDVPDFDTFISIYKYNYFKQMRYSRLYDGVKDILIELKKRGAKVSLLTTKAQDQAEKIIDYFELNDYFDLIMGRRDGIAYKPSPESLIRICDDLSVKVKNTLMIGDTELDIQCGKNAGSYTCAVLYGYRTKELLEVEKPDFIVAGIRDILEIV